MTKTLASQKKEYKEYIDDHIAIVNKVWENIKPSLIKKNIFSDEKLTAIDNLVINHDKSKYDDAEFEGYRNFFYPAKNEKKDELAFEFSWNHHQKSNPHHWEYWCIISNNGCTKALPMPTVYIFEMLLDWTAMSINFNNAPSDFYKKNIDNIKLNDNSRSKVEKWLPLFDAVFYSNN